MTIPLKYEDLVLKVAELERREAALREELDQCGAMAAMIEDKEWAEHAGSGPVSSRVESAFTQMHNELSEARERLTVAEQRAGKFEELLHMSRELLTTISRHGLNTKPNDWCDSFKAEVADRIEKIGAALNPAAEPEHICKGCGSKGWTANCDQCVPY